jgi:hypothetical protein
MSGAAGRCAADHAFDRIAAMTTSALIASSVWSRLLLAVAINAVVWLAVAWALDWFGVVAW